MADDLHSLAAPYALDALDEREERNFEEHLAVCERCRLDLAGLREAAAFLAYGADHAAPPRRPAGPRRLVPRPLGHVRRRGGATRPGRLGRRGHPRTRGRGHNTDHEAARAEPTRDVMALLAENTGVAPTGRGLAHLSDEAVLSLVASADDEALAELYDRFGGVAYGLALRILRDEALAQ